MFTGIIQQTCRIKEVLKQDDFMSFAVEMPESLLTDLEIGASVAIDGCCQTVRAPDSDIKAADGHQLVWFDAMKETLEKTTLGNLTAGSPVNVERSAKFGQEIGGHELSGHIDTTIKVMNIDKTDTNCIITLEVPTEFRPYVFNKGYLALHGASLTVSDYDKTNGTFNVYLIPETLRVTNLGEIKTGDSINMEIERKTQTIVDTVVAYMESREGDV